MQATLAGSRAISMSHLHTREGIATVYAVGEHFMPEASGSLDHFLRDHYNGEVGRMDPQLYELLYRVRRELGGGGPFEIISGYRSPRTRQVRRW